MKKVLKSTVAVLLAIILIIGNVSVLHEKLTMTKTKTITQVSTKYEGYTLYTFYDEQEKFGQKQIDKNGYRYDDKNNLIIKRNNYYNQIEDKE